MVHAPPAAGVHPAILICLLLLFASGSPAGDFSVTDAEETEINVAVRESPGDLLVIWLVDHVETRPMFERMLDSVHAAGMELWRVDLLADYFLPRSGDNIRTLPDGGITALLEAAHRRSDKRILLAAYDRMPLPLLRGVRRWQSEHTGESRLIGAVLFYPNLFGPTPVAGVDPRLDPVVGATNIPVVIYQPERGSHRWRLAETLQALQGGGSPALAYLAPGVRDWFFMHEPGGDPAETAATEAVAANLQRFARLLDKYPKPAAPPELAVQTLQAGEVKGLTAFDPARPAPPFDLADLQGNSHSLSTYRGKVALVNFWATWCPPCVEEIPSLNLLQARYAELPFAILSIDYRESVEQVARFGEKIPVGFPVLFDHDGRTSLQWKVFSFPSSYILDRRGNIRYTINRAIDWNTPEVWAVFDALLAEPE